MENSCYFTFTIAEINQYKEKTSGQKNISIKIPR